VTRGDGIVLACVLAVALLSVPAVLAVADAGSAAALISGPAGQTETTLSDNARYTVEGREGTVVFEVRDGHLLCTSSSCADQVCVRQREALPGRPVVCAPNGVVARVSGAAAKEASLDAVSR